MKRKSPIIGSWRIEEMEQWDKDFLDLVVPAYIDFDKEGTGSFQFGAVRGFLDCRYTEKDGSPFVEFSWDGTDEMDEASGRGWAALTEVDVLQGHIFFHQGDDSAFTAARKTKKNTSRKRI